MARISTNRQSTGFSAVTADGIQELRQAPETAFSTFAAVFFILLITLSPLTNSEFQILGSDTSSADGNPIRQFGYFISYLLALLSTRAFKYPHKLLNIPLSIALTGMWCALSITWALNTGVSARRLALAAVIVSNIFLLVQQNGCKKTLAIFRIVLPIILAANYVSVFGWPDWAIHPADETGDENLGGTWRGILMHKNNAGALCAFTIIFFAFDAKTVRASFRAAIIIAAAYFLYKTNSKTSSLILISSIVIAAGFTTYNAYYRVPLLLSLFLLLIIGVLCTIGMWDFIERFYGNGDNLTGRLQIWPALIQYSKDHWVLGSGFGSFWDIGSSIPIDPYIDFDDRWVAQLASGHNGYLDMLVQTGIFGLLLAVWSTVIGPSIVLLTKKQENRSEAALIVACVLFAAGHNFTESDLFQRDAISHVYLMFAIAFLYMRSRPRLPRERVS